MLWRSNGQIVVWNLTVDKTGRIKPTKSNPQTYKAQINYLRATAKRVVDGVETFVELRVTVSPDVSITVDGNTIEVDGNFYKPVAILPRRVVKQKVLFYEWELERDGRF